MMIDFPIGTLVNALSIVGGGLVGILFHRSIPERLRSILFHGLGLCVMVIGLSMALKVQNLLAMIGSLLLGAVLGEWLDLERILEKLGEKLKKKVASKDSRFTDGFVTASLIFCVGSMAVIGSLDDGIRGDHTVLFTKSLLDGIASIPLAATYGIGVAFSALPILIYQGGITLLASQAQSLISPLMLQQITAVGGVLILGIGINLLGFIRIKVTNMLPALAFAAALSSLPY